ncbi:DUF4251 domain-containing protein [uncultured Dokdonia sp.]|uniref:DUF4251 domain-containing protein n=1 Tax=uncultured Dokdonia sp. TaxID=575653 RepID=UPI002601A16F|nr:DUF4251 domain-containing protein [uncultured Dokdonia sp.]
MKTRILICFLLFSFSQIAFSQSRSERKTLKKEKEAKAYQQTKTLLDNGSFFFNAVWMYPRSGTQINLINNPGFIKFISNEDIDMYLPYVGIVRIGGGLNQPAAIQHKGNTVSYKIDHDDAKGVSTISFTADGSLERYDITMTVSSSGHASIFINSTKRDGIRYSGEITALEDQVLTGH